MLYRKYIVAHISGTYQFNPVWRNVILLKCTKNYFRLLETLDLKIGETAHTMFLFIVQFKLELDPTTRSWWEKILIGDKSPNLNELLEFLWNHGRSIMSGNQEIKKNISKNITFLAWGFQHTVYWL